MRFGSLNPFAIFAGGIVASIFVGGIAFGQAANQNVERFNRDLQQIHLDTAVLANSAAPADKRALLDYGGYLSASYLSLGDLNRDTHALWQYDLVGYADLNLDNVQEIFVRGRLEWQEFGQGDAFDGPDHQFHPEIERAYYQLDLGKALSAYKGVVANDDLAVKAGRQLVYWGDGLALSQTLDGALIDLSHKQTHLQILGGITLANAVDIDSSRPHFDSNTHRGFYGAMLSQQIGTNKPFIYFVSQQDYNHDYEAITGAVPDQVRTHFKYDSNYLGIGSTGTCGDQLSYGAEFVYESGNTLSNSEAPFAAGVQTKNPIEAFAADVRLDYLLTDDNRTRISGEGILATGDDQRLNTTNTLGGSAPNHHDNAYNGFGQVQNGIAFAPNISNLFIFRAGVSTTPLQKISLFKRMQVGEDTYVYQKYSDAAGLDEPSRATGFVGIEPDLFVNWRIKSDVTLAARYGAFFPGRALLSNSVRQFFYMGITIAF